ncbi:hypothetical protein ACN47E_010218 [Coniothyrium glycines]
MSAMNASDLTIDTAFEVCEQYPGDEICAICRKPLAQPQPHTNENAESSSDDDDASEVVTSKVCGANHFFHRACIMGWLTCQVPNLNTCPLDRNILFGDTAVEHEVFDNVEYAEFPGHDGEEDPARQFIRNMLIFNDYPVGRPEEMAYEEIIGELPGRAHEDVSSPELLDVDNEASSDAETADWLDEDDSMAVADELESEISDDDEMDSDVSDEY